MKTIAETAHEVWYNKKVRKELKALAVGMCWLGSIGGVVLFFVWMGEKWTTAGIVIGLFLLFSYLIGKFREL